MLAKGTKQVLPFINGWLIRTFLFRRLSLNTMLGQLTIRMSPLMVTIARASTTLPCHKHCTMTLSAHGLRRILTSPPGVSTIFRSFVTSPSKWSNCMMMQPGRVECHEAILAPMCLSAVPCKTQRHFMRSMKEFKCPLGAVIHMWLRMLLPPRRSMRSSRCSHEPGVAHEKPT